MKIEAKRIAFEWKPMEPKKRAAQCCWNRAFFYGDGSPATEPSVVIRYRDYVRLLRAAGHVPEVPS